MGGSSGDSNPFGSNAEIGVGFSDTFLLAASLTGLCVLAATAYSIIMVRLKTAKQVEADELADGYNYDQSLKQADVSKLSRAQRRARARAIMKEQRRVPEQAVQPIVVLENTPALVEDTDENGEDHFGDAFEDDSTVEAGSSAPPPKTRKERQLAAKATEKQERHVLQEERQERQKKLQLAEQKTKREKLREETRRLESTRQLEKANKLAQARAQTDARNTFMSSADRFQSVEDLISEMQEKRSVKTQDMAASFGVTQDVVIDRIQELVKEKRVSGVVESDGRFIYLSDEEMKAMADAILMAGEISAEEVATICNQQIGQVQG